MSLSAESAPTKSTRLLGFAGVLAGVVLLFVFVVPLDQASNPYRLILFNAFVIALVVGLYRQQSGVSSIFGVAAALVVLANGSYLTLTVLRLIQVNPFGSNFGFIEFGVGLMMWLAAALLGAAALTMRVTSRWGAIFLVVGSLLAVTGMGRLGLTGTGRDTIFGPLSQIGIILHGCGWILLGAELALRGRAPGASETPA